MKESAESIKYYYTGGAVLFTTDINNVKISENIVTPGGEVIGSKRFGDVQDGNAWYYFNYDMRGSTTVILKPDGGYKKDYYYDTFGNTTEGGGSFYNETQFTGATYDKSTGMHYMNARYYNPSTGRFLTQDSYTGSAYDPWTHNLYSYCMNNPINFIDPTGHSAYIAVDYMKRAMKQIETTGGSIGHLQYAINYAEKEIARTKPAPKPKTPKAKEELKEGPGIDEAEDFIKAYDSNYRDLVSGGATVTINVLSITPFEMSAGDAFCDYVNLAHGKKDQTILHVIGKTLPDPFDSVYDFALDLFSALAQKEPYNREFHNIMGGTYYNVTYTMNAKYKSWKRNTVKLGLNGVAIMGPDLHAESGIYENPLNNAYSELVSKS